MPRLSSLQRSCGQAGDEMLLCEYDEEQDWNELDGRGGEEHTPVNPVERSDHFRHDQRRCLGSRGGKNKGEEKLVPREDDHENGDGEHTLERQRKNDPEEDRHIVSTIDENCLVEFAWDLIDEGSHQDRAERHEEC